MSGNVKLGLKLTDSRRGGYVPLTALVSPLPFSKYTVDTKPLTM